MSAQDAANPDAAIELTSPDTVTLDIVLKGSWRLQDKTPALEPVVKEISSNSQLQHVSFSSSGITGWDSNLLVFLFGLIRSCQDMKLHVNTDGLPGGIRKLLELAASSPETKEAARHDSNENLLSRIGNTTIDIAAGVPSALRFLGESVKSIVRQHKPHLTSETVYTSVLALFNSQNTWIDHRLSLAQTALKSTWRKHIDGPSRYTTISAAYWQRISQS